MTQITMTLTADGQTAEFVVDGDFLSHTTGTYGGGTTVLQMKQLDESFDTLVDTDNTVASDDVITNIGQNTYKYDLSDSSSPNIVFEVTGNIKSPN